MSIADLIQYRRTKEKLIEREVEGDLDFVHGRFRLIVYRSVPEGTEHLAFVKGEVAGVEPVLVRMQTAQPLMSVLRADLGMPSPLAMPMQRIEAQGTGAIVLVGRPGGNDTVGDRLKRKLRGEDPYEVPLNDAEKLRDYGIGAQILADLGVRKMRLMTDQPRRIVGIEGFDLSVAEVLPLSEGSTFEG